MNLKCLNQVLKSSVFIHFTRKKFCQPLTNSTKKNPTHQIGLREMDYNNNNKKWEKKGWDRLSPTKILGTRYLLFFLTTPRWRKYTEIIQNGIKRYVVVPKEKMTSPSAHQSLCKGKPLCYSGTGGILLMTASPRFSKYLPSSHMANACIQISFIRHYLPTYQLRCLFPPKILMVTRQGGKISQSPQRKQR